MKRSTANWGKTIFPALFIISITILLVLPFRHPHAQNAPPQTTNVCAVQGAVADACYQIRPFPCTSGQAFWFPNADCHIPEGTDCINPQMNPSTGTDGFKYIFTAGPNNTNPFPGTFTEFSNGTASLIGHLESTLHSGYGFDVNIQLSGLTNNPNAGGNGPFLELDHGCYAPSGPVNPATWHFYNNTLAILTGTGNYAGAVVELHPVMHFFQVGIGASNKNTLNGMSAWFTWVVKHQPNNSNFCIHQPADIGMRTADFNLNCTTCTGKIGDFVWQDTNGNGCQDPGEPGMNNVQVDLFSGCNNGTTMIATTKTDMNGHYEFDNLCPGDYRVCFHTPDGFQHTVNNNACSVGNLPPTETDSNCLQTCTDTTCCVCATLNDSNGGTDLSIDCGYVPACQLQVTKSCVVPSPSPSATFSCSAMKPISSISQIWNGSQTINIKAWRGVPGTVLLSTQNGITPGQKVTVSGYTGTPNDVQWEIFDATTGNKIGTSDFHLSCSDVDMNGPEDCGKAEGDGKGLTGFINQWIFAGMSGANGIKIDCGSPSGTPNTSCVLTPGGAPDCLSEGHPTSLTFKYTGGGCAASNNPQSGKFICNGSVNTALPITVSNSDGYTQSTTTVSPGGEITFSKSKFDANSGFTLTNSGGTETLSVHTSCSQILAVGNVFGDFTLVAFNGDRGGNAVTYHYEVTNTGSTNLSSVNLTDDKLGNIATGFSLNAGQTKTFDVPTSVSGTTTNTATASAGTGCSASSGPVTVTVGPTPTPTPSPSPTPKKGMNNNCTTAGRPNSLTLTFTGGSCASSMNSQGPPAFSMCQKFCCTEMNGGLTGVTPVHIIVSSSSTTPATGSQRFFEGDVPAGGQFNVLAGGSSFGANTYIFISENGVLKQKVQMHTSCSAPLIRGETFGGVRLDDYAIVP